MSNQENPTDNCSKLRALCFTAKATRHDFAAEVSELNSIKLIGEASVFKRGSYVPITHLAFFKAPFDSFAIDLKSKDRRSAKEWDYINGAVVWLESGLAALRLAREGEGNGSECSRHLALAEQILTASLGVLSKRAQYFGDITENGMEDARQMAFLVEQGSDAVQFSTYKTAREALTGKLEIEAAKQIAKARLERATKSCKGGRGTAVVARDVPESRGLGRASGDVPFSRPSHQVWHKGHADSSLYRRASVTIHPPNLGGQGLCLRRPGEGSERRDIRRSVTGLCREASGTWAAGVVILRCLAREGQDRTGRFVVNLHLQSQHWSKESIKMQTLPSFALELEQDDFLFSFDVQAGYRPFYLHPDMRNYFLFHYDGRFYRCIALPFGWGRSPM